MLPDLLILPFSSTSTLLPSFVKHAQTAKKQVCWHLYIYFMRLFIFMELPSFVKDADGFNINLTGFFYAVVNSSPNKATTASFRLDQELIYLTLCTITRRFWSPPSASRMRPMFLSSPPQSTDKDVVSHRPSELAVSYIFCSNGWGVGVTVSAIAVVIFG